MRIRDFACDPELTEEFIGLAYRIYADDDNWIAPLESELRHQLSAEFAFFDYEGNLCRHFLAYRDGQVVGRVSAMVNAGLRDKGARVGSVGFFESVPDYAVAAGLLREAVGWLRQYGRVRKIWGPMNFDIWHGYRFMTRGFDQKLFLGEPYNRPYYPDFFTRFGFRPKAEWDSLAVTGRETLEMMIERGARRHRVLLDRGYRFEPFRRRRWQREVGKLYSVLCRSFVRFPGYTDISFDEFARLFECGRYALHPELFFFAYDEEGRLAGFAAAFVELGDAVRRLRGRDDWRARLQLLRDRRHADRINFYIGGITPEEEARRSGLGRAGFYHTIDRMLALGYDQLLLTLRLKGNSSRGLAARHTPQPQREYALYELAL